MIMGFIIHFYIIFGTNLLTGGLAQICCFMPISVFRGKGISDRVKTERNQLEKLFLEGKPPDGLKVHVRRYGGFSRGWGARPPPGRAPLPRGASVAPPTYPLHPYIPTYPKTSRIEDRSGVPLPQASVATKNQLGPCFGTLPEGGTLTGGHLHHPGALHDEEGGSSSPSGLRVCTSSYVFDLFLSCSLYGTILMYRELCYYSWIL